MKLNGIPIACVKYFPWYNVQIPLHNKEFHCLTISFSKGICILRSLIQRRENRLVYQKQKVRFQYRAAFSTVCFECSFGTLSTSSKCYAHYQLLQEQFFSSLKAEMLTNERENNSPYKSVCFSELNWRDFLHDRLESCRLSPWRITQYKSRTKIDTT